MHKLHLMSMMIILSAIVAGPLSIAHTCLPVLQIWCQVHHCNVENSSDFRDKTLKMQESKE
jgi:hypothetical protein